MRADPSLNDATRIVVDPRVGYAARTILAVSAIVWGALSPMVQLLLVFMVLDIISGVLAAYYTQTLNSSSSFRGMAKKCMILCLVALATLLEAQTGLPIAAATAGFYLASEAISVLENAAEMGVPIPQGLRDAMMKLSSQPAPLRTPAPPADVQPQETGGGGV